MFRIMLAKTAQCGEGVSFKEVRHVHIVEPPWSHTDFVQQCGRAVRVHSHRRLPLEHHQVRLTMYVATIPNGLSADELAVRHLRQHARSTCVALDRFCSAAIEHADGVVDNITHVKTKDTSKLKYKKHSDTQTSKSRSIIHHQT